MKEAGRKRVERELSFADRLQRIEAVYIAPFSGRDPGSSAAHPSPRYESEVSPLACSLAQSRAYAGSCDGEDLILQASQFSVTDREDQAAFRVYQLRRIKCL